MQEDSSRPSTENLETTIGVAALQQFGPPQRREQPPADINFSNDDPEMDLGDPDPPDTDCSSEEKERYSEAVENYANDMLRSLQETELVGEDLWLEFTSTFRRETIFAMKGASVLNWIYFLRRSGVYVKSKRGYSRAKALADCLSADNFQPNHTVADPANADMRQEPQSHDRPTMEPLQRTQTRNSSPEEAASIGDYRDHQPGTAQHSNEREKQHHRSNHEGRFNHRAVQRTVPMITNSLSPNFEPRNKRGIDSLMKAYVSHPKFSGSFMEDFDGAIEEFETLARLCEVSEEDMSKGFPIMLKGAAFSHYSRNFAKRNLTYSELIDAFRSWYTSEEQRQRLLEEWRTPSLAKKLQESPEKSELEVFRELSEKLTKIQFQLHSDYHKDRFLRDALLAAADVEHVRRPLKDKVPENAQETMQRIARLLSSEKGSAGANFLEAQCDEANYGFGKTYGGKARKSLKGGHYNKKSKSSRSLAAIKGCWVCRKEHKARDHHSSQDILDAINRLKREQPNVLFTLEDLQETCQVFVAAGYDDNGETSDIESSSEDGANLLIEESEETQQEVEVYLANASFLHGNSFSAPGKRSYQSDLQKSMNMMNTALHAGEEGKFGGIILDTGANRKSVMSLNQYKVYCTEFRVPMRIDRTDNRRLKGIGGRTSSVGTATIPIPFADLGLIIDVKFRIINEDCPSLLSLRDMKENGLDMSVQNNTISYKHKIQDLIFEDDFLKHKWKADEMDCVLYTEKELRRLHRVFGHPSVTALQNLLRRANPDEFGPDVKTALQEISDACETCERYSSRPRRFKLTVGSDDLRFNHIIAADVMYLDGRPVLHVVDEATHFASAMFLRSVSAEETWKCLLRCWIRTYLGPPDFLRIDQGSNFVAKQFCSSAEAEGIEIMEAPIECPSTMTHVERYHAPLRVAFKKIRSTLSRQSETDADCLQLAVKSVNDTIGPEGLCPTLLVFGSIPRPPKRAPADTQLQRARALDVAMKEVQKEQAKRKIAFGLKHPGGPKHKESDKDLEKLPSGAPVLLYRQKSKEWEGPFPFIHADGSTVVVQLPSGRKIFRSNVVKPAAHYPERGTNLEHEQMDFGGTDSVNCAFTASDEQKDTVGNEVLSALFGSGEQRHMIPDDKHSFIESRRRELRGLNKRKTFKIVKASSVPKGTRVYGTRWVDAVKMVDGKEVEKSRLVAQNFRDKGAAAIPTRSPTVSRMGQRMLVATASLYPHHSSYVRDISQAYIQSSTTLERDVYLRPPPEMNLDEDELLLALKPLYGIPESGMHWFMTYHSHHTEELGMKSCRTDPCVLYRREATTPDGVTALQVDDSYGHGTREFLQDEEAKSSRFQCKPRKVLKPGDSAFFNGSKVLVLQDGLHKLDQSVKLQKLQVPETDEDLVSSRASVQYIGSCTRPDLCAPTQLLASAVANPTKETYKEMEKIIKWCHATKDVGIRFVPLDMESCRLMLFTDSSFANTDKGKSQLGFVVVLADKSGNGNILHYGSIMSKRIARSVLAAELLALVHGFDQAYVVQDMLRDITGKTIDIDAFVDSRTLFNLVAKHSNPLEKRLLIDVNALRQSHRNGELRNIAWIPTGQNVADGLTKKLIGRTHSLWKLLTENIVPVTPLGWVKNSIDQKKKP